MQIMTALDLACERRHMEIITLLGEHERRESAQQLVKPALRTPGHPVDQVEEVEGTAFIPLTDELSGTVALEVADEASAGAEVVEVSQDCFCACPSVCDCDPVRLIASVRAWRVVGLSLRSGRDNRSHRGGQSWTWR
eukprot:m.207265 g.207265  ORF g.207265 m.207265 type:complete len:137 (-) comp53908_c0_seq46:227-637(-)